MLFGCGQCIDGQLGRGAMDSFKDCQENTVIIPLPRHTIIKSIAAGGDHSLAISIDNKLYSWGRGDTSMATGRSTEEDFDDVWATQVDLNAIGVEAVQATAGHQFSAVLVKKHYNLSTEE